MTENGKVIVLKGGVELAEFFMLEKTPEEWIPELEADFTKGHVIGYYKGKVVVLDTTHEIPKKACGCVD